MLEYTASELARRVGGSLKGDGTLAIRGVGSLDEAGPTTVSFLGNPAYADRVSATKAGAVLLPSDWTEPPPEGTAYILCDTPSEAFSSIVELFAPPPVSYPPGVAASAVVASDCRIPASAHIGPCAVVEPGVRLGERSVIAAGAYIGHESTIGEDCLLYPNVSIRERTCIGDRVVIHSGAVLGSDGFGFVPDPNGHVKIPQRGIVQVDDDVEIGAQVAIDRARFGRTWIKKGVKIDNLVHVGHNVIIGKHSFVVAQVGISGSTTLGARVMAAGQVGIAGHLRIGDDAVLMGQAGVTRDIPAGAQVVGMPAVDRRSYARRVGAARQVDRLKEELCELRKRVAWLEEHD